VLSRHSSWQLAYDVSTPPTAFVSVSVMSKNTVLPFAAWPRPGPNSYASVEPGASAKYVRVSPALAAASNWMNRSPSSVYVV